MRLCITGAPKTGKTTLANVSGLPVRHTDDAMDLGWSEASAEAAGWLDAPGPWVVEGVAVARALRKWLGQHPEGKPCDKVLWLSTARQPLTPGQEAMGKGAMRVLGDILPQLHARGVEFEVR